MKDILNGYEGCIKYLPRDFKWNKDLSEFENCILVITEKYDVNLGKIILPMGCVLYFKGGALLNVGIIVNKKTVKPPPPPPPPTEYVLSGSVWKDTVIWNDLKKLQLN